LSETRKIAAILVADVVGYSRLAGVDEDGTLTRLRALRYELIDPAVDAHRGRIVKRTGDGLLVEFRSVVDAVRCAIEVQHGMIERNAGVPAERRIELRVGVHLGDVVEENDGDLMGDGVNNAARLEGIANPSAICLSEDAYRQVKGRLDLGVIDLGPTQLKNIAEPIRVYSFDVGQPARAKSAPLTAAQKSATPRLSIIAMPFANIGGGPEQEPFVDGVTESLTTDLSQIRGAHVVARNTAFTYKGRRVDVKTIGRELNVRYVLEGSVQRGGNRMRVNVQLSDAETGNHLWAERFDKPLADLFDMQDEIVARLAGALNARLVAAEARRAEQAPTPDNVAQARSFFDRALTADAVNVDALVGSAWADTVAGASAFVANPMAAFAAAEAKLAKALSLVPDHAPGHMTLGHVCIYTKRAAQGIAECEHALALDRNLAAAHALVGLSKMFVGRAEETEAHVGEATRLSPCDTSSHAWKTFVGVAKLTLGSYEQAAAWFRRAIEDNRNYPIPYFLSAAGLAQLGRLDDAHSAVKAGLALNPTFAISRARAAWTAMSDNPTYLAQLEPIFDGLRKAGVPEQ
jgi:TolB-like protein/class 3 adenylate cyclase